MTRLRWLLCGVLVGLAACSGPTPQVPSSPPRVEGPPPTSLRVDHAWVRDVDAPAAQAQQAAAIATLRAAVLKGGSFETAWQALGVAPETWHIGEGETYPYEMIHPDARDLPVGQVSEVLPGDGGLHLFRILGRE